MRRREFIGLLGSAAAGMVISWPQVARAQQPEQIRRLGVLMAYTQDDAEAQKYVSVFRDALKEFDWVDGRNLAMIEQWPGREFAAIQQAAKDLIKQEPDVILSSSTPTTAALLRENRTIPIVFAIVSDPIGSGFVKTFMPRKSLSRPPRDYVCQLFTPIASLPKGAVFCPMGSTFEICFSGQRFMLIVLSRAGSLRTCPLSSRRSLN